MIKHSNEILLLLGKGINCFTLTLHNSRLTSDIIICTFPHEIGELSSSSFVRYGGSGQIQTEVVGHGSQLLTLP